MHAPNASRDRAIAQSAQPFHIHLPQTPDSAFQPRLNVLGVLLVFVGRFAFGCLTSLVWEPLEESCQERERKRDRVCERDANTQERTETTKQRACNAASVCRKVPEQYQNDLNHDLCEDYLLWHVSLDRPHPSLPHTHF